MSVQPDYSYPEYYDEIISVTYPIQKHQSLEIYIDVYDKDFQLIRQHKKDYNQHKVKGWLTNMLLWAMKNNCSVEVYRLRK